MRGNFDKVLPVTLAYEGGYSLNRKDPGNWTGGKVGKGELRGTNLGVAAASHPNLDIKNLTVATVSPIYRRQYWDTVSGDSLAAGVDLATFDAGVMSGPARALKWLMASVGGTDAETVKKLCGKRLGFVQSLKIWQTFKGGWSKRIAAIEAKGVAWALASGTAPEVVKAKLKVEENAATKKATQNKAAATTTGTATAAGGTDAVVNPSHADALGAWLLGGLLLAGAVLVAILVVRAIVNKHRADAYRAEQI